MHIKKNSLAIFVLIASLLSSYSDVAFAKGKQGETKLREQACYNGDLMVCNWLGLDYYEGKKVSQNYQRAAAFWKKACDGGELDACIGLGLAYAQGQGVKQDLGHAAKLWHKACDGGKVLGCKSLHQFGIQPPEQKAPDTSTKKDLRPLKDVLTQENSPQILAYVYMRCGALYLAVAAALSTRADAANLVKQYRDNTDIMWTASQSFSAAKGDTPWTPKHIGDLSLDIIPFYQARAKAHYAATGNTIDPKTAKDLAICQNLFEQIPKDSALSNNTPQSFWCRKLGNRQCFTSEKKCVDGFSMVNGADKQMDCFSVPTAWCFYNNNPFSGEQMICVGHKADCEDWRKDRKGDVGPCLKTSPKEVPKE